MVGGKATQSTPTSRSAEPRSTSGQPGSGWWCTRPATSTADEAAQGRQHAAHGEDDEGGDERGLLGLGPEALALDDQQRQDAGADDERDDVGRVEEVQGERGDEQRSRRPATSGAGP